MKNQNPNWKTEIQVEFEDAVSNFLKHEGIIKQLEALQNDHKLKFG